MQFRWLKKKKSLPKVATGGKFDNILNEKELVADVSNFSCLLPIILYEVELAAVISYVIITIAAKKKSRVYQLQARLCVTPTSEIECKMFCDNITQIEES